MIKVFLNVVGLYYGEWVEVDENPTVFQVLEAAEAKGACDSGQLTFEPNAAPHENSILFVENDLTAGTRTLSRKTRDGVANSLVSNKIRLTEGIYNQPASDSSSNMISVAWQYYIEKLRSEPPKVTTTYSIDDVIIDAGESNSATEGKKITEGDTVTLRLLCINTTKPWVAGAPGPLPPRKASDAA